MKRLSPQNLPWLALAAFVVILAAEGLWLRREQSAARRAEAALGRKLQERDWLAAQTPAPNADNEEVIGADLERARQALADAKAALRRGETGREVEPAPTQTLEAYFRIASFVERSRVAANTARVMLRPEERFGFAAYAHEGPAVETLPQVHRQLLVSEILVTHLIEARPRALLGMQREAAGAVEVATGPSEDYFVMDRALSVRRPDEVETVAFRVEFSGQTATLRHFLTAISALPQPFLVRRVEVEPLPVPPAAGTGAEENFRPLVRQQFSRFAVTVESIRPAKGLEMNVP